MPTQHDINIAIGSRDHTLEGDEVEMVINHEAVVYEKCNRSLAELTRWYAQGRLTVNQAWQRNTPWTQSRASRLIESLLLGLPVPALYLVKTQRGTYDIIDGRQRLQSVAAFFEDGFALQDLPIMRMLNGKQFTDLSPRMQNDLLDATLYTFELSPQASKDLLVVLFERLHDGG